MDIIRTWKAIDSGLRITLLISLFILVYLFILYRYHIGFSVYFYGIWTSYFTLFVSDIINNVDKYNSWKSRILYIGGIYIFLVVFIYFLLWLYNLSVIDIVIIVVSGLIGIIFAGIYSIVQNGFKNVFIHVK